MKYSKLFTKTLKEISNEEVSKNANYLTRGGFIHKELAGVYTYLPMGLKVIKKIQKIVEEEMDNIGGQQLLLSSLQNKEIWEKTGRWSDEVVDVWFKSKFNAGGEIGFGPSHEEPLTNLLTKYVKSYQDLPFAPYQIQTKFRNELRAKSGIMRGREFIMKDMYSFHATKVDLDNFYDEVVNAYTKICERIGLGDKTYYTIADGGMFTDGFSYEFQTVCDSGEDTIYIDNKSKKAVNDEVLNEKALAEFNLKKEDLTKVKASEVGNVFKLGTKYSKPLGLSFTDHDGKVKDVLMGCYGIGISRLMGVVVEACHDEKGIIWPQSIAPFKVCLINLGEDLEVKKSAEELYQNLLTSNIEVLYDDRENISAGEKFADADLIGLPIRIVVSKKTTQQGGVEIKNRNSTDTKIVMFDDIVKHIAI